MWGVAPRVFMTAAQWDKVRNDCYAKANFCCEACGVPKHLAKPKPQLDCHELYSYNFEEKFITLKRLVALCKFCHDFIHKDRLAEMTRLGIYPAYYRDAVIAHGERVLSAAGLPTVSESHPEVPPEDWGEWHYVDEKNERHYSNFLSDRHLTLHYENENRKMLARKNRS